MQVLTEPGLYHAIMRSNKKEAEKFQEKIYTEILPSIRKTGEYKINQELLELKEENTELKQENVMLIEDKNKLYHDIILANAKAFQRYSNIKQYMDKAVVYLIYLGITYSNLGLVTNSMGCGRLINQRLRCVNTLFTERYIKKYRDKNNLNIKFVAKGANKTEIICCRDQQEVEEFLDHFNHLTRFDAPYYTKRTRI